MRPAFYGEELVWSTLKLVKMVKPFNLSDALTGWCNSQSSEIG
jgi:hypothetical protein